jgi:hypothetical protein
MHPSKKDQGLSSSLRSTSLDGRHLLQGHAQSKKKEEKKEGHRIVNFFYNNILMSIFSFFLLLSFKTYLN